MTTDGDLNDNTNLTSSASDASRFDYRLTGWARESHNAAVYCVAFCGKGAENEDGSAEKGGGDEGEEEFPLDRVFASAGSRRVTVYLAPKLSEGSEAEEIAAAAAAAAAETATEQQQRLQQQQQKQLPFSVLQTYLDAAADEEFYVCRWAHRRTKKKDTKKNRSSGGEMEVDGEEKQQQRKKKKPRKNPAAAAALPLLLAGGRRGVLRVIDPSLGGLFWTARGHGGSINDIAVHPARPGLALTASRDQSVRLWNLESRCCVAQFAGGDGAHVAEVLSVDWHPLDPDAFASSGYDSSVKVWSIGGIRAAVEASFRHERRLERKRVEDDNDDNLEDDEDIEFAPFAPRIVPSPRFSSQKVHSRVADCVRWLGPGVLLSKTVDDRVLAWSVAGVEGLPCPLEETKNPKNPTSGGGDDDGGGDDGDKNAKKTFPSSLPSPTLVPRLEQSRVKLLNSLRLSEADDVWFVRFSLDARGETLACGGKEGRVCVFDPRRVPLPTGGPAEPRKKLRCAAPRGVKAVLKEQQQQQQGSEGGGVSVPLTSAIGGDSVVRQTALSDDGSTLLASCDDGTIWRFDRPEEKGGWGGGGNAGGDA